MVLKMSQVGIEILNFLVDRPFLPDKLIFARDGMVLCYDAAWKMSGWVSLVK